VGEIDGPSNPFDWTPNTTGKNQENKSIFDTINSWWSGIYWDYYAPFTDAITLDFLDKDKQGGNLPLAGVIKEPWNDESGTSPKTPGIDYSNPDDRKDPKKYSPTNDPPPELVKPKVSSENGRTYITVEPAVNKIPVAMPFAAVKLSGKIEWYVVVKYSTIKPKTPSKKKKVKKPRPPKVSSQDREFLRRIDRIERALMEK
jgi:hypothetical protein